MTRVCFIVCLEDSADRDYARNELHDHDFDSILNCYDITEDDDDDDVVRIDCDIPDSWNGNKAISKFEKVLESLNINYDNVDIEWF